MIPAVKRQRTEESSFTSVTSKLTTQSASIPTSSVANEGKTAVIQPYTELISRVNVSKFFYTAEYEEKRDLFLYAMSQLMNNTNINDPWSYYAIAGIHGLPAKRYDSATPPSERGYCEHGTVLFPTWHRPYVLLIEQAIIREALNIADKLEDAASKAKCRAIANSLRIPYLDWESPFTAYQGIPDVFTKATINVTYPYKEATTIPNPLRSYVLPVNLSKPISASDIFNPPAKPNYNIPQTGTPFTPANYPTVRHPDGTYQSQMDTLNLSIQRACNLVFRPQLFAAMQQTDWAKFSNHYSAPDNGEIKPKPGFYGHYASIEVTHDAFHDAVGGTGGHMSYPDIAAFDPIFWFHHCNVDRLLAIWQYANPQSYVPDPTAKDTGDKNNKTPLAPFWNYKSRDNDENPYLNSLDVKSIIDWKYSYPLIDEANKFKWSPEKMKLYILQKFQPDNHYGIRWYLNILKLPKRLYVGPYKVRVFIDAPDANIDTPINIPNYAGYVSVFARSRDSNCETCEKVPYVRGTVELTTAMKKLGISVDTEPKNDIGKPISIENPPNDPFNGDFHSFTLVYVTAAGKEELTAVYNIKAGNKNLTLNHANIQGKQMKLNKEVSNDSTGKYTTMPDLCLSWAVIIGDKHIVHGDVTPEQMNDLFNSYSSTVTGSNVTGSNATIPKISYIGGIVKTNE